MKEYKSRWEYLKDKSPWHFDPKAPSEEEWKILGRFNGDWVDELNKLIKLSKGGTPLNFFNKMGGQNPYTLSLDKTDIDTMALKNDTVFLNRIIAPYLNRYDAPLIFKMVDYLGLEDALPKIHIQHPGQVFPLHVDDLTTHRGNSPVNESMDTKPGDWARFEVQLKDWCWGHVWGIGNSYWKQWSAGDIMWHPWWIHPHGTANFGLEPRINLQVTGKVTQQTVDLINSEFKIIDIKNH